MAKLNKSGLTMIEVLLVVSIVSVLSLALYNTFSNGLKVWERSHQYVLEEDVAIFFDRIGRELRNSFRYEEIPFFGYERRIVIPTMVQTLISQRGTTGKALVSQMGAVQYDFQKFDRTLFRTQRDYSEIFRGLNGSKRETISNVIDVKFQYFFLNNSGQLIQASSVDEIPPVIRIKVKYRDYQGVERILSKTIIVPSGFVGEEEEA